MKRICLSLVLLFLGLCAYASDYMFKHLEVKDGLSNNHVNAIFKDSHGFMWFGTTSGLNRYDGTQFTVFLNYDLENGPLAGNYITDIQEDGEGNLWIGTDSGYSIYNMERGIFVRDAGERMAQLGVEGHLKDLYVDQNRNLWLYVAEKGCYLWFPESRSLLPILYDDGRLPRGEVTDFATCSDGVLLVYNDGRVVCLDKADGRLKWQLEDLTGASSGETLSLFVDSDDDVWIYGASGLWIYNVPNRLWKKELADKVKGKATDMVQAVAQARNGLIWIGRDQRGICVLDKVDGTVCELVYREADERSLQNNSVISLYEDSNGIMWVGTFKKGLSYYSESMFKFGIDHLGDVNCVEDDKDGYVWLGTNDEGLVRWNRRTGHRQTFVQGASSQSLSSNAVVALKRSRDGRLWIGTFRGGLDCYANGHFVHYRCEQGNPRSLAHDNVWALEEDKEGNLWIATLGGGLQCLEPKSGTFTTYTVANAGLLSDFVMSLDITEDGRLLMGTAYGLSVMDLDSRKVTNFHGTLSGKETFSSQNINQVMQDSRGLVWVATREGLNVYDMKNDRLVKLSVEDGLSNRLVTGVVEDHNRNIWAATAKGLTQIVPFYDSHTSSYTFRCQVYDDKDGLQNCEFNHRSLKALSDGQVMVGGMYGVNTFHPDEIRHNKVLPKVMFTRLFLFNEEVRTGQKYGGRVILDRTLEVMEEIRLPHSQNVFSLSFVSDNFILPEKTQYAYRLDGFSTDWLTTRTGKITYTNLSPGTYTLRVKAVNSDGYSGSHEAALRIVVEPPFWLTPWALAAYVALLAGGLWFVRGRKLRKRDERKDVQYEPASSAVSPSEAGPVDADDKSGGQKVEEPVASGLVDESEVLGDTSEEDASSSVAAHPASKVLIEPAPSEIAITSMDQKLIDRAVKYIENNISRSDLSVEELSQSLGMSRVHLYKRLLAVSGKTPIEFIRVIRLKRAAQLLRESQQNVSEIAYQVGFNNPKYFSKYFREEYGVLPSVYQNRETDNK